MPQSIALALLQTDDVFFREILDLNRDIVHSTNFPSVSETCPVCLSPDSTSFFELSEMPVFIGMQWDSAEEARACDKGDIDLAFCNHCGFIWNQSFNPERLAYSRGYDNSLDASPVFQNYTRDLVRRLVNEYGIRDKQVLELGCGKGVFLAQLCEEGHNRGSGFDPSYEGERSTNVANDRVTYIQDFFGEKYASHAGDLVCCRHVFEHVPDPVGFLEMIRRTGTQNSSTVYFEVPNARFIFAKLSVWDIIYEHCNYFSAESLSYVFRKCGFEVLHLDEPFAGQFLSIEARVRENNGSFRGNAADLRNLSKSIGRFSEKVSTRFEAWKRRLNQLQGDETRAVIWGGGAKTVGFLNMLKVGTFLPYVVDINPRKQGRYLSGTGQRIVSPEFLREFQPTQVILMNPIYHQEVAEQLQALGVAAEIVDV
jgi:SAM-dependent methyltransferase